MWVVCLVLLLTGCSSIAVTMLGVGVNAGISQQMQGNVYRTFTEPLPEVLHAAEAALYTMGVEVVMTKQNKSKGLVQALVGGRQVEVELEKLTPSTTRMRVVAKRDETGFLLDASLAMEIVAQTKNQLAEAREKTLLPAWHRMPMNAL